MINDIWNYKILTTSGQEDIMVHNVLISIILFFVGFIIIKRLNIIIKLKLNKIFNPSLAYSLSKASYYSMFIIIILLILKEANILLTALTLLGTTFALSFGLGTQYIVANFFNGLIIMSESSIKVGDTIEIKDKKGEVIDIGIRCITIRTNDDTEVMVPNNDIIKEVIVKSISKKL